MAGWIAPAVAGGTRVCIYDRAGRGWSESAAGPDDGVAGVVILDSMPPDQYAKFPGWPTFYENFRRVSALLPSLSRADRYQAVQPPSITSVCPVT